MLDMQKNLSKPYFLNASTVLWSCKEIMSSSSCSRSCHVITIFIQKISEIQTTDELGSKFEQKHAKK